MLLLSCSVPQQMDTYGVIDEEFSSTDTLVGDGEETSPTDALIALCHALNKITGPSRQTGRERQVNVPADTVMQMNLLLLDYCRTLESLGPLLSALPTSQQREIAVTAYQSVRQSVAMVLRVTENLKGLQ